MSWLNLNQSLNSLKGQITNFASEVLSEGPSEDRGEIATGSGDSNKDLEEKCKIQEAEIQALKRYNEELQDTLQRERLSRKNGVKDEESGWYWDPKSEDDSTQQTYIQNLQKELSDIKQKHISRRSEHAQDELTKLREENKILTDNLEELDKQHQTAMDKLLTLKKELERNIESLRYDNEILKTTRDEMQDEVKMCQMKLDHKNKEVENLFADKADYDTLSRKYQNLERVHGLLKENAEKFQEENQELHEEVFKLQEQIAKLENDVDNKVAEFVSKNLYGEVLKELHVKNKKDGTEMDTRNFDDNAKGLIKGLKMEIQDLQHKLEEKSDKALTDKITQLYEKYVTFDIPVDYIGEMPSVSDNLVYYKLDVVFKTLNQFKNKIDALQNEKSSQKSLISGLQNSVEELTGENEILLMDVNGLEKALSEMKKNNEFLLNELANLKNNSKLQPIIETHEDNLVQLENELESCTEQNKNFEFQIKRIEEELTIVNNEKHELQKSLSDLRVQYTAMLADMDSLKADGKTPQALEDDENLNLAIRKISQDTTSIKNELLKTKAETEKLAIDLSIKDNEKVLCMKEADDLKQEIKSKDHEIASLKKDNEILESQLKTNKTDISLHKKDISHSLTDLTKSAPSTDIKQKQEFLEIENAELKINLEKLQKHIIILEKRVKDLISAKNNIAVEIDNKVMDLEKAEMDLELCNQEKASLDVNVIDFKFYNETCNNQIDSQKKIIEESKALLNKTEERKKKLIEEIVLKDSEIESLNTSAVKQQKVIDDLNSKYNDIKSAYSLSNQEVTILTQQRDELAAKLHSCKTNEDALFIAFQTNKNLSQKLATLNEEITEKDKDLKILQESCNEEIIEKNKEFELLKQTCDDIKSELNNKIKVIEELNATITHLNSSQNSRKEDHESSTVSKLLEEKSELTKEITKIKEVIAQIKKEYEILQAENVTLKYNFSIALQEQEKTIKELEDLKDNTIKLNEEKIIATNKTEELRNDLAEAISERTKAIAEIESLKDKLSITKSEKENLKTSLNQTLKELNELKSEENLLENKLDETVDNLNKEKNELINLVNLKHNESVQYHNEIQRLNAVILEHSAEFKKILAEKEALQTKVEKCTNCDKIKTTIKEKDQLIIELNHNSAEFDSVKAGLNDTIKQLTDKCDSLNQNLTTQFDAVKKLTIENRQLSEKEVNTSRELDRLRQHLIELEESHTQELMASEHKLTECTTRLHQVEERAKQNSTVYTSSSIRANQEVETLRTQLKLLEKQRDEVQAKLIETEDSNARSEAALTNLQLVLQQFQMDKDRDIEIATERIRNKMAALSKQNGDLQAEIVRINAKLAETLNGLKAANRLGDELANKTAVINDLKEQVRALQASVTAAEERYHNALSNQQDRVDKNLVKNLVVNFVSPRAQNANNRAQVLRILSTVLDFNQQECEVLGLSKKANTTDSLATEFVKFLEKESRPSTAMPNMMNITQGSRSTTPVQRKNSGLGPSPNPYDLGHKRNTSTGSNNLLFQNADLETSSQISFDSSDKGPDKGTDKGADKGTDKPPMSLTSPTPENSGFNQTRNNEGSILKHVLKDM